MLKSFNFYYKRFEKKFHLIMDDLEFSLEEQKKQIFAQNQEEYNSFLKQAFFCFILGLIICCILFWLFYKNNQLYVSESFMPLFHTIKFPKSHIIRFVQFPNKLIDFDFRYYKPLRFVLKFDLTPKIPIINLSKKYKYTKYMHYSPVRFVLKILPKNW